MWLLTYSGLREDTSYRNPEQLTVLAPKHLQDACLRFGGVNLRGEPNFRLVLVSSRYMIAGGSEFMFQDAHGNCQKTCPAEMLIPRYPAEEAERGLYLLERWHPPKWFYDNGFGGRSDDVEYSPCGQMIRRVEPIWPEGGYEACWWRANQLFVFPRDVSASSGPLNVAWAIQAVFQAEETSKRSRLEALIAEKEREEKKSVDEGADIFKERGRADLFLGPAVSLTGIKEDSWQKKESCASAQATD